jgi:EAL domain-containing protein (putative c-di-GMP-specific phosphodiesterase class I)
MGYRIAVDDLGAGYAGLTSLVELDPDVVKLDMALIRDIDRDPRKRRVVASLVRLCTELDRLVIAEGVERQGELEVLRELGCDLIQGYLLARPGPPFPEVRW